MSLVLQCLRYYAGWADKIHGNVINPSGPFAKGTSVVAGSRLSVGPVLTDA